VPEALCAKPNLSRLEEEEEVVVVVVEEEVVVEAAATRCRGRCEREFCCCGEWRQIMFALSSTSAC
jgi:hypothetical protein